MKRGISVLVLTVAVLALAGTAGANGVDSVLRLSVDGGDTWAVVVADNGPGDTNAAPGIISFVGSVGPNWSISITSAVSKPASGSVAIPAMQLNTKNIFSTPVALPMIIQFSDQNFGPLPEGYLLKSSVSESATTGTVSGDLNAPTADPLPVIGFSTWGDTGNGAFVNDGQLAQSSFGLFGSGTNSGSAAMPVNGPLGGPYSLTMQAAFMPTVTGVTGTVSANLYRGCRRSRAADDRRGSDGRRKPGRVHAEAQKAIGLCLFVVPVVNTLESSGSRRLFFRSRRVQVTTALKTA